MVAPELRAQDAAGKALEGDVSVDCEKATGLLSDYIDRLAGLDRVAVESHIARCPRCAEVVEDLKAIS